MSIEPFEELLHIVALRDVTLRRKRRAAPFCNVRHNPVCASLLEA
jgi:hypothetical protein